GCSLNKGCGTASIDRLLGAKRARLKVMLTQLEVRPGDQVIIGIPEHSMLRMAVMVYFLPLVGMIFGALAGGKLDLFGKGTHVDDLSALLFALVGFALSCIGSYRFLCRVRSDPRYQPQLMRNFAQGQQGDHLPLVTN
ncbi:MAG TPA: hypothetical protein DCZ03_06725, partial [Gammaproteobacteria bacterium]|nr:hypothetical protein [Gammaproteobacteria bacterium]